MNTSGPRHSSGGAVLPRKLVYGLVAAVTVCLVAVAAGIAIGGAPGPSAVATANAKPSVAAAGTSATAAPGRRTGGVTPEVPRRVELPSGRAVGIRPVDTTSDGTLDVPDDVHLSGWWRGGSRVGDPFGSMLLAAHVDSSTQGLGPYAELLTVEAGQRFVVTSEHLRQEYVISSLRLLDKGPLSDHPSVYSPSGSHRLTMVTCAGPYVLSKGGYQNLAVVTATPVGPPTPRT